MSECARHLSLVSGMFTVCILYVACSGLSDLGNGPNKPTATIIGECSASLQDAALVFTLVSGREFQILTKTSVYIFDD